MRQFDVRGIQTSNNNTSHASETPHQRIWSVISLIYVANWLLFYMLDWLSE